MSFRLGLPIAAISALILRL